VPARDAFQAEAVLLEAQHAVVTVQPAECLANPLQNPFAKTFNPRLLLKGLVWDGKQPGEITDHRFCSSCRTGASAI
jgi:hypothetical protein